MAGWQHTDARRGIAWAFFGSAMAAAFMVPWKAATAHGEPRLAVLTMLTSAAFFNSALAVAERARGKRSLTSASWRATLGLAAAFAVLTLVGNSCSAEAIARISGALLSVVQRCEVILVALLGAVFLRERVSAPFWVGAAVAGTGLWLLKGSAAGQDAFDPVGALYGLGSATCFGTMVLLTRRFIRSVHLLPFNTLRLWLSVALWFGVERALPTREQLSGGLLVSAALAGFFGPFLSRIGALQSGRYIPAQLTALASLASPIMTLVLAYLILGDLPTRREVLGGCVMLVGVAIPLLLRPRIPDPNRPGV